MAIHNEPGRGRKQCGQCKKYVGVRSHTCENCQASFGPSTVRAQTPAPFNLRNLQPTKPKSTVQISPPLPEKKSAENGPTVDSRVDDEKGSRVARINRLKTELIRELRNSARSYGAEIVREISDQVLKDPWD